MYKEPELKEVLPQCLRFADNNARIRETHTSQLWVDGSLLVTYNDQELELTFHNAPCTAATMSSFNKVLEYFEVPADVICREGKLYLVDRDTKQGFELPAAAWRWESKWEVGVVEG